MSQINSRKRTQGEDKEKQRVNSQFILIWKVAPHTRHVRRPICVARVNLQSTASSWLHCKHRNVVASFATFFVTIFFCFARLRPMVPSAAPTALREESTIEQEESSYEDELFSIIEGQRRQRLPNTDYLQYWLHWPWHIVRLYLFSMWAYTHRLDNLTVSLLTDTSCLVYVELNAIKEVLWW